MIPIENARIGANKLRRCEKLHCKPKDLNVGDKIMSGQFIIKYWE
jgi:hypothetical protein